MSDVCGIIADIKREGTGVYEFRKLTLLGFDTADQEIKTLLGLGLKVGDANEKYEGVEIPNISPFKLMRHLAKEFGYKPCVPVCSDLPGDRKSLIWTMVGGEGLEAIGVIGDIKRESEGEYIIPTCTVFGLDKEEISALLGKGVSFIKDENPEK
ncbi:uncharacterized protein LOC111704450 [Eurytemora carolleeae]|uniref:uncharacterized protein LOC111704450 n=1 Tax=Eurytemora carolleeae TaxID=1294199 RepID=UPI000C766BD5|nr:uncharacterized protein LOC111704450 [Eurytemora carolleeae]|eukprot:XP_023332455.1 uncharacterized protein LOC111704450 [Eurytemora affinis]